MTTGPLTGLRVMDATILGAGPYTGSLLAELGADVIKVEGPDGDGARWQPPTQRGVGTVYLSLNVSKRDITLDFKDPGGYKNALALASTCDVFVQNFRGGVIERLGLGYDKLREVNPRVVYCAISGFGEIGPLSKVGCNDGLMQAFSGFARLNGAPGDKLEQFRFSGYVDLTTSIMAVQGILAALVERESSGEGQKIDVSMLEAALEIQATRVAEFLATHKIPHPMGSESPGLVPDRAFATMDREVFVTVLNDTQWQGFCKAVGQPALATDPRFSKNKLRVEHREDLYGMLLPILLSRPAIWWMRVFERNGVPCGLAQHFEINRYHQQVRANEMIVDLETPDLGRVLVGGVPWHFSKTPCQIRPAPRPGEATEEILAELEKAAGPAGAAGPPSPGKSSGMALSGIRVVEFTQGPAGAICGLRLGDLGAQVVKVEAASGDWLRNCPPLMADSGESAVFFALNRGKRCLALGENPGAAKTLMQRLVKEADVFITDRTLQEMDELGLGSAEKLCGEHPRLIVATLTDFGEKGPLKGRPGSELIAQAMSGYTRYLGAFQLPARRLGADVANMSTGTFTTQAVLAALFWRSRTGEGQHVSLSLLNSLFNMKTVQIASQSDPDRWGGPRVGGANYQPIQGTATADKPIIFQFSMGVGRAGFEDFLKEVGLESLLNDPKFDRTGRDVTGLGARAYELGPVYESALVKFPAKALVEKIRGYGGISADFNTYEEMIEEPQTKALQMVREVAAGAGAKVPVLAFPGRFSRMTPALRGGTPHLGGHNEEIAAELGLAKAEIEKLVENGGLFTRK